MLEAGLIRKAQYVLMRSSTMRYLRCHLSIECKIQFTSKGFLVLLSCGPETITKVYVTHRSFGCANLWESDMQIRKSLKGDDYFKQYRLLTAIVENLGECAIPFGNPHDTTHRNL